MFFSRVNKLYDADSRISPTERMRPIISGGETEKKNNYLKAVLKK